MKKSKGIAYALWLIVGLFGGHKFYLGKVGEGLLMLFTAGGLGIWWFVNMFTLSQEVDKYNRMFNRYSGYKNINNNNNNIVVNVNNSNNG